MTTFLSKFNLCLDLQGETYSYLSTQEYGVLRQVCRDMSKTRSDVMHRCVRSYRLHGLVSYERLMDRIPLTYLEFLCVESKNVVIPCSEIIFPKLRRIKFYAMYTLYTVFFNWDRFFLNIQCPMLCEVEWQNVPFPFDEMRLVLKKYGIGKRLTNVVVPQDMFQHHLETSSESYNQSVIAFYKECPNLERLRLDMDTKSMDPMYVPLFIPPVHFLNLRTLQLVNRSKTLVDTICNDVDCLPKLECLEILWIYDSNPLFPTVQTLHHHHIVDPTSGDPSPTTMMSMPLVIRKPTLRRLRLSYYGWRDTSLYERSSSCPLQCYLTLETDQSVRLILEHVCTRIVSSTYPPLDS